MKKITKIFALILSIVFLLAFSACNKTNENSYKGWEIIEERINGVGDQLEHYAVFRITTSDSNRKLKDLWINASGLTDNSVTFEFAFSNSSSLSSPLEKSGEVTKEQVKENDGWVKVLDGETEIEYSYIEVYVTQNMNFNEMVLVSTTGKKLNLTLIETGARPSRGSNSVKYKYTQNELEAKLEEGEMTTSSLNLIDEQSRLVLD